jgi:hypothetical protein
MMKPTIHLNGTSAGSLAEQYADASAKVRDAIRSLEAIDVNGRDYYPQGNDAFGLAIIEHKARIKKLIDVRDELYGISEAIADQS